MEPHAPRTVLHLDMDAFYASVEQLDHPELRGRPVLVGHDGPRGVVAAASYEARRYGCRSAQPISVAKRMCPQAAIVPVRGARYAEVSDRMFSFLHDVSPLVEPLSIDEAFVELTGTERLLGPAVEVAQGLRARIRRELGLTASAGIAPNKFLAKLASDLDKPDGLTVIGPGDIDRVLPPLPVERLWGVGPVTAQRLHDLGIRTIGDLRRRSVASLVPHLGEGAEHFIQLAHGLDDREVVPDAEAKSIGHEDTFSVDVEEPAAVRAVLLRQTEQVGRRLRRHGLEARGVTVKIRYGDFETITRAATLDASTDLTDELWRAAAALFDRWVRESFRPVRLIGVTATRLGAHTAQGSLFPDAAREKRRQLDAAVDALRDRFGARAVRRAAAQD